MRGFDFGCQEISLTNQQLIYTSGSVCARIDMYGPVHHMPRMYVCRHKNGKLDVDSCLAIASSISMPGLAVRNRDCMTLIDCPGGHQAQVLGTRQCSLRRTGGSPPDSVSHRARSMGCPMASVTASRRDDVPLQDTTTVLRFQSSAMAYGS